MAKKPIGKVFAEFLVGFIMIQAVAYVVAASQNFSILGAAIALLIDGILMVLLISRVADEF